MKKLLSVVAAFSMSLMLVPFSAAASESIAEDAVSAAEEVVSVAETAVPAAEDAVSETDSFLSFGYYDDLLEDGRVVYYFDELSLTLPADWRGNVFIIPTKYGYSFYQRASYDRYLKERGSAGGGFLFELKACSDDSYTDLPQYEYLGVGQRSGLNYYLQLQYDYRAYNDPAIKESYDRMFSQVSDIAETASFYPAWDTDYAAEDAVEAPWTAAEIRYSFEQRMLPHYFYDNPVNMLNTIDNFGMYALWESVSTENGADPAYPAEDYREHWYAAPDTSVILQVELPDPDANLLCYRIYFVYTAEGTPCYFTAESELFAPDSAIICTKDSDGTHMVCGTMPKLDRTSETYEEDLADEAAIIAALTGIDGEIMPVG